MCRWFVHINQVSCRSFSSTCQFWFWASSPQTYPSWGPRWVEQDVNVCYSPGWPAWLLSGSCLSLLRRLVDKPPAVGVVSTNLFLSQQPYAGRVVLVTHFYYCPDQVRRLCCYADSVFWLRKCFGYLWLSWPLWDFSSLPRWNQERIGGFDWPYGDPLYHSWVSVGSILSVYV